MANTSEDASKARAARIHEQIAAIQTAVPAPAATAGESPRAFVHRRMAEIAAAQQPKPPAAPKRK